MLGFQLRTVNNFFDVFKIYLQDILNQSTVALNMEVRPKYLVPDTNCFVDYLHMLQAIGDAYPLYQLMVPLVGKNTFFGFRTLEV